MDRAVNYSDILTRILREQSETNFPLQPDLKIVSSCDRESGQFLLIMIGWDRDEWVHSILFHAQLINGKVIIEADMTEEGLKPALIEAGILEADFLSDSSPDRNDSESVAA